MNKTPLFVGIFVAAGVLLFGVGLFLIGNEHKAFTKQLTFYAEFANLHGMTKGAKVRVAGMDAGQIQDIQIPDSPAHKFRLKLQVDSRLRGLVRSNSVVTIASEGLVGDQYLLIDKGSDDAPAAAVGGTLVGKEPVDLSKMLEQAQGLLNQAGGTLNDVHDKLDTALDSVTTAVNNTNGIVTDIRHGKGAVGTLLEDRKTADQVKQIVASSTAATANINNATVKVNGLLDDFQQRQLFAKAQQTLDNANDATVQLKQASQQANQSVQQLNQTLTTALAPDQYGQTAGSNLQQTLSNVNQATGNLADDTAALSQEFFFKGFFKKRGYDSLDQLPEADYRSGKLLRKLAKNRNWLDAATLFTMAPDGTEVLSTSGRDQLDQIIGQMPNLYSQPVIVEGYDDTAAASEEVLRSRARAMIVRAYLQIHYHLQPKNIGVIGLRSTPPADAGKSAWNGVCLVQLSEPSKK